MNTRTSLIILFLILTSASLVFPAPQSVIRCKVKSFKATPYSFRKNTITIPGTVSSKATNEYYLEVDPQPTMKLKIKLTSTSPASSTYQLKLDLYSVDPPQTIKKKISVGELWEDALNKKKYLIAVNNCANTRSAQFTIYVERVSNNTR